MRRIILLPGLLVLTALAAVLLVYRVLGGHLGPGPLGFPDHQPGNEIVQCFPGRLHHADTEGSDSFDNTGDSTLVIDSVTLASARHLRLVGAYIVPGRYVVGGWASFPPPARQLDKGVQWAKRRRPAGTRVLPGHWINIVVGLEPTAAIGSTAGIEVHYHDGYADYELQSTVRTIMKVPPRSCT